jgi:hypothetical protein
MRFGPGYGQSMVCFAGLMGKGECRGALASEPLHFWYSVRSDTSPAVNSYQRLIS